MLSGLFGNSKCKIDGCKNSCVDKSPRPIFSRRYREDEYTKRIVGGMGYCPSHKCKNLNCKYLGPHSDKSCVDKKYVIPGKDNNDDTCCTFM